MWKSKTKLFLNFGGCSVPGIPDLLEQWLKSKCSIPNMLLYSTYLGKKSTKFQLFHIQYNTFLELCNELTIIIVNFQMEGFTCQDIHCIWGQRSWSQALIVSYLKRNGMKYRRAVTTTKYSISGKLKPETAVNRPTEM